MSDKPECPFIAGATVARVTRQRYGGNVRFVTGKISKVYKSGHFVLEGDKQQWRPTYYISWSAHRTGGHGHCDYDSIEPITPELIEESERTTLRIRFLNAIEIISQCGNSIVPTKELTDQVEAFAAAALAKARGES